MNRVDFYILPADARRDRYACNIANKAWLGGYQVYIQVETPDAAKRIDDLMWTYHDISFIPHTLVEGESAEGIPVLIGCGQPPVTSQVLINLAGEMPADVGAFERIVEIVSDDEEVKSSARERYRKYRQRGLDINNHVIEHL